MIDDGVPNQMNTRSNNNNLTNGSHPSATMRHRPWEPEIMQVTTFAEDQVEEEKEVNPSHPSMPDVKQELLPDSLEK